MKSLYESSLLLTLFPELKGLENLGQNQHHHLDVLLHTLLMVEKISWAFEWINRNRRDISLSQEDWLSLYYATLFHDIGKQDTYSKDEKEKVLKISATQTMSEEYLKERTLKLGEGW
jgi:HD superfamily phosphodiesterase